jgi:glycosyltransferase involved in cell wall biosynthesis
VLLSQGTNADPWLIQLAEALIASGIPYVVVSHSAFPWYWPPDGTALRMAAVFRAAQASYFVSEANVELTRRQVGDPIPNAQVIRNPFNVDYDATLPYPAGEVIRLACVGSLTPGYKGQDILLDVLSRDVWRHRPIHVTFYGDGHNREIIRRMQERFQVRNVSFAGHQEPRAIWRDNHALVLSSRAEGLPIVIVEAMLCGRVCIVTNVGGIAEVVEDGVDGFLSREVSATGFHQTLERAWERRGEWQKMGELAGAAIRRKVPRNPAECLAQELKNIIARLA